MPLPKCEHCNNDAACVGIYEDPDGPLAFACDMCCAHGNEDGRCWRLADAPEATRIRALPAQHPGGDAAGLVEALEAARPCLSETSSHHGTAVRGCTKCERARLALSALDRAINAYRRASPERVSLRPAREVAHAHFTSKEGNGCEMVVRALASIGRHVEHSVRCDQDTDFLEADRRSR